MLIAGLVATNDKHLKSDIDPNYKQLYEIALAELEALQNVSSVSHRRRLTSAATTGPSEYIKWLPTCDIALGARYVPDKMYTEPGSFNCVTMGVPLPDVCNRVPKS